MLDLILECGLFTQIDADNENYFQLSGESDPSIACMGFLYQNVAYNPCRNAPDRIKNQQKTGFRGLGFRSEAIKERRAKPHREAYI